MSLLLNISGFKGEIEQGETYRRMYATDASIYCEVPMGVGFPKDAEDLKLLVRYASEFGIGILARGGGTSLAGQTVGEGIVVDFTRYMCHLIRFDEERGVAWVEPGLVRDELNRLIAADGWWFGPNTATSDRATMGGMVSNNSSGSTSIKYGVTREKILGFKIVLNDGVEVLVEKGKKWPAHPTLDRCKDFLDHLYHNEIEQLLSAFPHPAIHRRNSGYALDQVLISKRRNGIYNLANLISGAEGTLGLLTAIKLQCDYVPYEDKKLVLLKFKKLYTALESVPEILEYSPDSCELMDRTILNCARQIPKMKGVLNYFYDDPEAVLMVQISAKSQDALAQEIGNFSNHFQNFKDCKIDIVTPPEDIKIWDLRKKGLGILSNLPGEGQAIACVEDTAVRPDQLSEYIREFSACMKASNQEVIYYAHAGAGELHIRPIINLRTHEGREQFLQLCQQSAQLVKKYNGSLSGEHGDGRVRAPYLKEIYNKTILQHFENIKQIFDPHNLFNPGKIVHPKYVLDDLRVDRNPHVENLDSPYHWNPDRSILAHVERCNGSAECTRSEKLGGDMCPTYQVTKKEEHSTRGRANLLRHSLLNDKQPLKSVYLKEAMHSCVSCKACKSECPSGVDMAQLKSEYLYQTKAKSMPMRDFIFTNPYVVYFMNKWIPFIKQWDQSYFARFIKAGIGIAPNRSLHMATRHTAQQLITPHLQLYDEYDCVLFVDEMTEYLDAELGRSIYLLLVQQGYRPYVLYGYKSGRAELSLGYLEKAKHELEELVGAWSKGVYRDLPLIGIEPSAVLGLKDEALDLLEGEALNWIQSRQDDIFLIEEFLVDGYQRGFISWQWNESSKKDIILHDHCHTRALTEAAAYKQLLNLIPGMRVHVVTGGCCGMAGAFGYQKENYAMSVDLFNKHIQVPIVQLNSDIRYVSSGISCRHQMMDLGREEVIHPIEIIIENLADSTFNNTA